MKKIMILGLLFMMYSFSIQSVQANDYTTYQEIVFEHSGGLLLEKFSDSEYETYYDKLGGKRFWGWKTFIAYKNEPVTFTRDTLYIIYNEGETAITESIKLSRDEVVTRQYSTSGSIGLKGAGNYEGFKLNLDSAIDYSASKKVVTTLEEEYQIKVSVDPYTKLTIKIKGEGKVTSGVGKYYRFWKNVKKGGWEIFVVTTEYYSIEKVIIDET